MLVDRLYDWLSQGPPPDCDRILAAGIPLAEPEYQQRIIATLLKRENEAAWGGLIGHFNLLDEETRARLRERAPLYSGGLAQAMRGPIDARLNALEALEETPDGRLAYLVVDALRHPEVKLRIRAERVLKNIAESLLDQSPSPGTVDSDALRDYQRQRQAFTSALPEALRLYDLHRRSLVLKVCLWFAMDLGPVLWQLLGNRRSRAGNIVTEHLRSWNSPRLAGFLIGALREPSWRQSALDVLINWKSLEEARALLEVTDLLRVPEIRTGLATIKRPQWLISAESHLDQLEPHVRARLPEWICAAGMSDDERVAYLSRVRHVPYIEVKRSAVYALASLKSSNALRVVQEIAAEEGPLQQFACWYLHGREHELVRQAVEAAPERMERAAARRAHQEAITAHGTAAPPLGPLWRLCRAASGEALEELLRIVRSHAGAWAEDLREKLVGADLRDRLLALRVVGTRSLAPHFRPQLQKLAADPADTIRRLASQLLANLHDVPSPTAPLEAPLPPTADVGGVDQVRSEYEALLEEYENRAPELTVAQRLRELTDMLMGGASIELNEG